MAIVVRSKPKQVIDEHQGFTKEQKLWLAVVHRALMDYWELPKLIAMEKKFREATGRKRWNTLPAAYQVSTSTLAPELERFLFGSSYYPGGLEWIADHVCDKPDAFVAAVRKAAKDPERRKAMPLWNRPNQHTMTA